VDPVACHARTAAERRERATLARAALVVVALAALVEPATQTSIAAAVALVVAGGLAVGAVKAWTSRRRHARAHRTIVLGRV
jgi:uncharacterized protein HemX